MSDEPGRLFRDAWITSVRKHFPGEPKPGYVTPWEQTPGWERSCAAATQALIQALVRSSENAALNLKREQKGQFVAACWNAQIYRHIRDPKPSYVAPWDDLPAWQKEVNADIFNAVAAPTSDADRSATP